MFSKKLSFFVLPLITTLSLYANDPFMQDPFGDDIFKEMMQMQQEMDEMFQRMHSRIQQRTTNQISPMGTYKIQQPSQFVDKGKQYEFVTTIPESKENQIDIHSENGIMAITAKIIQKQENRTANSYSSSSSMRMYQQSVPLPTDADEATINMGYIDGKLVITVSKKKGIDVIQHRPIKIEKKTKSGEKAVEFQKDKNNTRKIQKVSDDSSMS